MEEVSFLRALKHAVKDADSDSSVVFKVRQVRTLGAVYFGKDVLTALPTWLRKISKSQINDLTGGRHLGFSNFQILFKFSLLYLRLTGKQHLVVEIHEIDRIHCEAVSIL